MSEDINIVATDVEKSVAISVPEPVVLVREAAQPVTVVQADVDVATVETVQHIVIEAPQLSIVSVGEQGPAGPAGAAGGGSSASGGMGMDGQDGEDSFVLMLQPQAVAAVANSDVLAFAAAHG